MAPNGGTAAASVGTVARCAVAAIKTRSDKNIPIAEGNFTWVELLNKLSCRPRKIYYLPSKVMSAIGTLYNFYTFLNRSDDLGLHPRRFISDVLTKNLFIDQVACREAEREVGLNSSMRIATAFMNLAFAQTVNSCFTHDVIQVVPIENSTTDTSTNKMVLSLLISRHETVIEREGQRLKQKESVPLEPETIPTELSTEKNVNNNLFSKTVKPRSSTLNHGELASEERELAIVLDI